MTRPWPPDSYVGDEPDEDSVDLDAWDALSDEALALLEQNEGGWFKVEARKEGLAQWQAAFLAGALMARFGMQVKISLMELT
ncbi:MAG: hypothetical protein PVJ86_12210 [Phycisphaerales bacterium]|jgi:hypothetical protein